MDSRGSKSTPRKLSVEHSHDLQRTLSIYIYIYIISVSQNFISLSKFQIGAHDVSQRYHDYDYIYIFQIRSAQRRRVDPDDRGPSVRDAPRHPSRPRNAPDSAPVFTGRTCRVSRDRPVESSSSSFFLASFIPLFSFYLCSSSSYNSQSLLRVDDSTISFETYIHP